MARIGWPDASLIASTTSRVEYTIDSTTARVRCARPVPRVMPTIVPRAYGSQYGDPRPVNAGTHTTPSVSSTDAASGPASAAFVMMPRPSRSHWIAAPVTKIAPSYAYVAGPPSASCQATVVSRPSTGSGHASPTFISTNDPVPYVFFVMPVVKHACPKSAACWSPAMPLIGTPARSPGTDPSTVVPN